MPETATTAIPTPTELLEQAATALGWAANYDRFRDRIRKHAWLYERLARIVHRGQADERFVAQAVDLLRGESMFWCPAKAAKRLELAESYVDLASASYTIRN
ncbi:hypothetical protein [Crossiella sp. S99.2]|uniref:hypothetical protein n=1 Tax=Crossiella sp. S99.2 TaxID=2936272 RepID=UPI00200038B8|nr:hypothetical protein [Crossiella sp. S99.2]MCK2238077.1 hypothetical protein [Crossiella sp. S99.2]